MPVEQIQVTSVSDLVDKVVELGNQNRLSGPLWFRGLSCRDHGLVPSIMRDGKTWEEVVERENRLLLRFRQRSLPYWPAGYPQANWEHLFAMQHYGMPTRLLDWTESLPIAAYFALRKHKAQHAATDECGPVVYAMDPTAWNGAMLEAQGGADVGILNTADADAEAYEPMTSRRMWKYPVAMHGTHNSARIVAQRGTFLVWGNGLETLQTVATPDEKPNLWAFNITGNYANLQKELRMLGISETTAFPEMSSLAEEISRTEAW